MTKTIKVKIGCEMSINNISKLIHILERVNGTVRIKKDNIDRLVDCTLIGIRSLNLHRFDIIEIQLIDCVDAEYQAQIIESEIKFL